MAETRGWAIKTPAGRILWDTATRLRQSAILAFMHSCQEDRARWEHVYQKNGYHAVRIAEEK